MNSMQRVLTTLGHQEPDRVPQFLLPTMHGAKELGVSIEEYFSRAENVVEGQLRMRKKFRNDCLVSFFYAPIEVEAWGSEVIYAEDGPPNTGEPFIKRFDDIRDLEPPRVRDTPCLRKVLDATHALKQKVGDEAPIIGVVVSPFSLPVMQMGFPSYLELLFEQPELFQRLMAVNQAFCIEWANAQLAAGATAITYFDPVSSTTNISREQYLRSGFPIAKATLAAIEGPVATHFASGRCLPLLDDVAATGCAVISGSYLEDLAETKRACKGRLTVLGNLNGIAMRRWSPQQAEQAVKQAIADAAPGGGYILSDNHGEIPWQVPEEVIMAISEAVHQWGRYPLDWVEQHE